MKTTIGTPVVIVIVVVVVIVIGVIGYRVLGPTQRNVTPQEQIEMMKHMKK